MQILNEGSETISPSTPQPREILLKKALTTPTSELIDLGRLGKSVAMKVAASDSHWLGVGDSVAVGVSTGVEMLALAAGSGDTDLGVGVCGNDVGDGGADVAGAVLARQI
jgi:hypothetical protein